MRYFFETPTPTLSVPTHQRPCSDVMAAVESVKAASDVYAPVSGVVSAVNAAVVDTPALVNSAAEGDAWFVKLTLADGAAAEAAKLMDAKAYKAHCDADAASH